MRDPEDDGSRVPPSIVEVSHPIAHEILLPIEAEAALSACVLRHETRSR